MSSNDGVWLMFFEGMWHVWNCSCATNEPERPNKTDEWYKVFHNRGIAVNYAHELIKKWAEKDIITEYGIIEVGMVHI